MVKDPSRLDAGYERTPLEPSKSARSAAPGSPATGSATEGARRPPRAKRTLRAERAQSLVEFSMVFPILIVLVFAVIDFGMGLRAYISVSQASREGARYAAVGNPGGTFTAGGSGECNGSTTTTAVGKVCSTLDGLTLTNIQSVAVTYPNGATPGNSVHVQVQYRYHYITPLKSLINMFSAGSLPGYLTISSTTDMRLE